MSRLSNVGLILNYHRFSVVRMMTDEIRETLVSSNIDAASDEASARAECNSFDEVIGHIEDLLLDPEFHLIQQKFREDYWHVFEPEEENKLIYTDIFNDYNKAIENHIVHRLRKVLPHFDIDAFLKDLSDRQSELDGEVFEVLSTITDFMAFKEMILDYRAVKEGKVQELSSGISITSLTRSNAKQPT